MFSSLSSSLAKMDREFSNLDALFDSFLGSGYYLRSDIQESKDGFKILVDVPGVSKDNIEIQAQNDTLTLICKRNEEQHDPRNSRLRERRIGEMSRTWNLPNMDKKSIRASLADGVLTINLSKKTVETDKVVVKID